MKQISSHMRDNIVTLIDSGLSTRKIASKLKVSQSKVSRVRSMSRESVQKGSGGRPPKLTTREKGSLCNLFAQEKQIMLTSSKYS